MRQRIAFWKESDLSVYRQEIPWWLFLLIAYAPMRAASGPVSPRGHMQPSSTVDFDRFVAFWEHQNFSYKIGKNFNFVGL